MVSFLFIALLDVDPLPAIKCLDTTNDLALHSFIDSSSKGTIKNFLALHLGYEGEHHADELPHLRIVTVNVFFDTIERGVIMFHLFHEDGIVDYGAGQSIQSSNNDTLYLSLPVALTHKRQLFALPVFIASKCFPVHHAHDIAMLPAILTSSRFLLI